MTSELVGSVVEDGLEGVSGVALEETKTKRLEKGGLIRDPCFFGMFFYHGTQSTTSFFVVIAQLGELRCTYATWKGSMAIPTPMYFKYHHHPLLFATLNWEWRDVALLAIFEGERHEVEGF